MAWAKPEKMIALSYEMTPESVLVNMMASCKLWGHLRDCECIDLFRVVSLVGPVRIMLGWIVFQVILSISDPFLLIVGFGLFVLLDSLLKYFSQILLMSFQNFLLLLITKYPSRSSLYLKMLYDIFLCFIICLSYNIFTWLFGPS